MSKIKKFEEYSNDIDNILQEGSVAEPTVKPTVAPGIKKAPGKASPLRKDRPSVLPGPNAMSDIELANKFLNMTKNIKSVQDLLIKKYNK